MKRLVVLALLLVSAATARAQSPIDGVWRMNLQDTKYVGQENFSIEKGRFRCPTCDPKIDTVADGADHPLSGSPYYDAINVRVVDDRTVAISYKKKGTVAGTSRMVASMDGKSMKTEFTFTAPNGEKMNGGYSAERVGSAPSGHAISGVWQPGKLDDISENAREVTYKTAGNQLSYSDKGGNAYTASFDGKDYPFKGDPGITTVSLRRVDANTIEETFKRDGKIVFVSTMTLAPNQRTMTVTYHDKVRDVTTSATWNKQ